MSVLHFYDIRNEVLDTINTRNAIGFVFPGTTEARKNVSAGFRRITTSNVFNNVIGCIDGWMGPIKVPQVQKL